MKVLSIVGIVIALVGAGAGLYNLIEFVPKMSDDARDLFGRDLWYHYHEQKMMWGYVALGSGTLAILLGAIGGLKKQKLGWVAVAIGLVSLFFGLSQATHMFS